MFFSDISNCFVLNSYKYIGKKSIERRKKRKPNKKSSKVIQSRLSDEERKLMTNELLREKSDKYGIKQTKEYFDTLFLDSLNISTKSIVKTRTDAMMIAACIIYSGSEDFPYEVDFLDGIVETDVATVSNILIKRKGNR